jgi:hypothetical protein
MSHLRIQGISSEKMTKHLYLDSTFIGCVILGQYPEGDIRDGLKKYRNEFNAVKEHPNKWMYSDFVMHGSLSYVSLTVSYEGSHSKPEHILASALALRLFDGKGTLERDLDYLLRITGIIELETEREQFEAEPFKGWAMISQNLRL